MKLLGIYFDGKTSKSRAVHIYPEGQRIGIFSADNGYCFGHWEVDDCTSEQIRSRDQLIIKYGHFPQETLELKNENAEIMYSFMGDSVGSVSKLYDKVAKLNPLSVVVGGSGAIFAVFVLYFLWIGPTIVNRAMKLVPPDMEAMIGDKAFTHIENSLNIDSAKTILLQEFFAEVGFKSQYNIDLHYSNDETVNAFALPGGKIVIFDGLIQRMECWDELVGLISHEMAHVDNRHSLKNIMNSLAGYIIFSALSGDASGISVVLIENSNIMHELSNSRAFEKEADLEGLETLKGLGIRPAAMRDLLRRLLDFKEEREAFEKEEFVDSMLIDRVVSDTLLSKFEPHLEIFHTHPLTRKRIEYINERIDEDSSFHYEGRKLERAEEIFNLLKE